jgi:hypothetical protein
VYTPVASIAGTTTACESGWTLQIVRPVAASIAMTESVSDRYTTPPLATRVVGGGAAGTGMSGEVQLALLGGIRSSLTTLPFEGDSR